MAVLCEPIDKCVVETLLCSGGDKTSIGDIHREGGLYDKAKGYNYYAFAGIVVKINPTQQDGITVYKRDY